MKTTLAAIRAKSPCTEGWQKLTSHLGGIDAYGLTTPLDVAVILDSNGFDDALWVLDKACGPDGKRLCHVFACDVAERVLPIFERASSNDTRPRKVIEIKRLWIAGEATDEELFAAWEAAWEAARDAARDATRAAARAAAWAAARDARDARDAWEAARDAAWAAASAAAWDAAWDAGRDADWDADWAAERDWQIAHLHEMLKGEWMTDIKERLRAVAETVLQPRSKMPSWMAHTAQDAHAEIERLESAIVMRKAAFEAVKDDSIAFASENVSLRAERDALQASNERMEAALRRARDDMEGWAAYAAPNFREKWDLDGDLAAIDEALTLSTQPVETDEERDERRADVIDPEAAIRRILFGQVEPWDIALSKARAIAESDKKAGHG